MPSQLLCRVHAKPHLTKLWIPILEKSKIGSKSPIEIGKILHMNSSTSRHQECAICACVTRKMRGEMTIAQHLKIARGKKPKTPKNPHPQPNKHKLSNGTHFTFPRYNLQMVWTISPSWINTHFPCQYRIRNRNWILINKSFIFLPLCSKRCTTGTGT